MRQVRIGVFETNSSSTHAICIDTDANDLQIPYSIIITPDDYGWGWSLLDTPAKRASYYFSAIWEKCVPYGSDASKCKELSKHMNRVVDVLTKAGVTLIEFDMPSGKDLCAWGLSSDGFYYSVGVDHIEELEEFLNAMKNDRTLIRFILGSGSYVVTGNDNVDTPLHFKKYFADDVCQTSHRFYQKWN